MERIHEGTRTHREVIVTEWGDGGEDAIGAAVTGEIVHICTERFAGLNGVPHQQEGAAGHDRMPNDVVRRADEFFPGVPGESYEHGVRLIDDPASIGRRKEQLVDPDLMPRARRHHPSFRSHGGIVALIPPPARSLTRSTFD